MPRINVALTYMLGNININKFYKNFVISTSYNIGMVYVCYIAYSFIYIVY